jgi:type II secretory pathway component GspD/PulD (secretin)
MRLRSSLLPALIAAAASCQSAQQAEPAGAFGADGEALPEEQEPAAAFEFVSPEDAAEPSAEPALVGEPTAEPAAEQFQEPVQEPSEEQVPDLAAEDADALLVEAAAPAEAAPTALPTASTLQDDAQAAADRVRLVQQKRATLAADRLAAGERALAAGDLNGALENFAKALELSPDSAAAREKLQLVEGLMGEQYSNAAQFFQDEAQRAMVRRAQAMMAAESAVLRGDAQVRAGEYESALGSYREAEIILQVHPSVASNTVDAQIVATKLESARRLLAESDASARAVQVRSAERAAAEAERERRDYRANTLRSLYEQAYQAYNTQDYSKAEGLAEQILAQDPGNADAQGLLDAARTAPHAGISATTARNYRESWQTAMEEVERESLPQSNSIEIDLARWAEVDQRRPLGFAGETAGADPETEAILRRLESFRFRPQFVGEEGAGAPLADVARFLQAVTNVNFVISQRVDEDLDEEQKSVNLELPRERSARAVLDLIAELNSDVRWKVESGVVKFVTKDELKGGQVLRMYEVRDLIHPIPDFPSQEINIQPSGKIEPPEEDVEEREALVVTSDSLESLIRDNVDPNSWNDDPANSLRIAENGTMVVYQTPAVHAKIEKLLSDLRESTGIMVDIQARFLKIEDNFLEDIGVDWRGLGSPGLGSETNFNDFGDSQAAGDLGSVIGQDDDVGAFFQDGNGETIARVENLFDSDLGNPDTLSGTGGATFSWTYLNDLQFELIMRAVSKSERIELVTAPSILVHNTARSNLTVLNQVLYVQDFDVEIAQGASIADPILDVAQDGVVLDVRPVVSADRRFVKMEVRPTVVELVRPIPSTSTGLGSQNSVVIQLPEANISQVRTTVQIPDGGTVMLGGFKIHENQELHSGVPFLSKVPVLSFFFDRKGTYVSNRRLLILLKATIVIPEEHEPTRAQIESAR